MRVKLRRLLGSGKCVFMVGGKSNSVKSLRDSWLCVPNIDEAEKFRCTTYLSARESEPH